MKIFKTFTYDYASEIKVKALLSEVFHFFSQAENLERLTPPWLKFKILTPLPISMHAGTLINYRLSLYGLPLRWQTEITVWEPAHRFIDSQLKGPYKSWIHEHLFTKTDNGCLIKDKITYQVFGWIFSPLINHLFVKRDIGRIFNYRKKEIEKLFLTPDTGH